MGRCFNDNSKRIHQIIDYSSFKSQGEIELNPNQEYALKIKCNIKSDKETIKEDEIRFKIKSIYDNSLF